MPELPEVETLKLQLSGLIIGQTIKEIKILKAKSFIGDQKLILGTKITGINRFAKLIILELDNGLALAIHLKMTGQLVVRSKNLESRIKKGKLVIEDPLLQTLPNKHTRVIIYFSSGDRLYFNDLRIFGWMKIVRNQEFRPKADQPLAERIKNQGYNKLPALSELIDHIGPEPFKDLTLERFQEILKSSKKPVKIVLMDQEKIAGVGNIYANDALFLSRIHPKTRSDSLTSNQAEILYIKLLKLLKDAIKWGGASEDNFRDAYGQMGHAHEHFLVYAKKGEPCPNKCKGIIQRIALGGRGTFFCPKCQA